MLILRLAAAAATAVVTLAACDAGHRRDTGTFVAAPYPAVPIGTGPRFHPRPAAGPRATCRAGRPVHHLAHLELFAAGRVVLIPAGIGMATQQRCTQRVFTTEPTGVLVIAAAGLTLADLFRIWNQPLSSHRLLGFTGRVRTYVAGRRWTGDPRSVPLSDHTVHIPSPCHGTCSPAGRHEVH
jgi:hypothetical protein